MYPLALLGLHRRLIRARARIRHGALPLLLGDSLCAERARLRPTSPLPVGCDVHGNPEQPRVERRLTAEGRERVKRAHERLLGTVPGLLAVAQQLEGQTKHALAIPLHERFER